MIWLFDIDGTLVRCNGAGSSAMSQAFRAAFGKPCDLTAITFSGRTDTAITADIFNQSGIPLTLDNVKLFNELYLAHLPAELESRGGTVLPGAREWVERIASHANNCLGIVTGNMRASAEIKLQHFDLQSYFPTGGYGDKHADRYQVVADAISCVRSYYEVYDEQEIWTIGDTPLDISAARHNDIRVVAVATGGASYQQLAQHRPDELVESLINDSFLDRML